MAKNKVQRMLFSTTKEISKTSGDNGVLAALFRKMLRDLNISMFLWNILMESYIGDPRNGIPHNTRDQTSARGNLVKELERPQMTWKVFCKALRFLRITRFDMTIHATHVDGSQSSHMRTVDFGLKPSVNEQQVLDLNQARLEDAFHQGIEEVLEDADEIAVNVKHANRKTTLHSATTDDYIDDQLPQNDTLEAYADRLKASGHPTDLSLIEEVV